MEGIYHRKEIGERVAYYRKRSGLSQVQLAECSLCSTDFIEQIERYGSDVSCPNTSPWTFFI
jgi:transcriptional regulator with XRE-family HTH domain